MLTVVVVVFYLFSSVGLLCEWCCLGDGSSKISLLESTPKGVCYRCVDQLLGIITTCLFGDHVWTKNTKWNCQIHQHGASASLLFCKLVALIIQLYGGYFSSTPFWSSTNVSLSTGHCCERRVLMAVDIFMCFKMDISICGTRLNEDLSSLILQEDVWGLCWTCSKVRRRFSYFFSRKLLNQL